MVLTVYKVNASPPARAVLMTIETLKISDVQYIDLNLLEGEHLREEYTKLNPLHTIPLLKDDDFVVWDSHAICTYLVTVYGDDDNLYPKDPKKRATVDQRLHFDSGTLFPAVRGAVEPILFWGEKKIKEESFNKIQRGYEFTDKLLTSDWIAGDVVTLADICCISSISSANEILPIDQYKYVNLWAWFQRCATKLSFYKTVNEPGLQDFRELLKSKLE